MIKIDRLTDQLHRVFSEDNTLLAEIIGPKTNNLYVVKLQLSKNKVITKTIESLSNNINSVFSMAVYNINSEISSKFELALHDKNNMTALLEKVHAK